MKPVGSVRAEVRVAGVTLPVYSLNTLVIGSGAAGLNAALQVSRYGQRDIAIVTERLGAGTSNNAGSDKQTYYKLSLAGRAPDSPRQMAEDLFRGGSMHGDLALCEAQHSAQAFLNLVALGVPFPHTRYGGFVGYRTDHDPRGRGTSAGPWTSRQMCACLGRAVQEAGIPVFDRHVVVALLTCGTGTEKCVCGAVALDESRIDADTFGLVLFNAVNVILATGGPGGMYRASVYPESQVGATGMALAIGAVACNLTESQFGLAALRPRWNLSGSYQQVIPRYVSTAARGDDEREFLGDCFPDMQTLAAAIFRKGYEWPFDCAKVADYGSSLIDLLVYRETVQRGRRVFLDYTRNPSGGGRIEEFSLDRLSDEARAYLRNCAALLPTPIERLAAMNAPAIELFRSHNIDLARERLEIAVCAQHCNGGLRGNLWWESNVRHLFPIGEVNGSHGVRRPGGAALNAGQVGGLRAALFIARRYSQFPPEADAFIGATEAHVRKCLDLARRVTGRAHEGAVRPEQAVREIQDRMSDCTAHVRSQPLIVSAVESASELLQRLQRDLRVSTPAEVPAAFRALDLCLTHAVYLEAICEYLERGGESRGGALVLNLAGQRPCDALGDEWRFLLNEPGALVDQRILEVVLDDGGRVHKQWVDTRPIPDDEEWFETVWKDYRSDRVVS